MIITHKGTGKTFNLSEAQRQHVLDKLAYFMVHTDRVDTEFDTWFKTLTKTQMGFADVMGAELSGRGRRT